MITKLTTIALVGAGVAGCASHIPPTQKLIDAEAAARGAEEVGAASVPQGKLHLTYAREAIEQAKQLMRAEKNERAAYVLMRAKSDADLALAEAREDHVRRAAESAQREVAELTAHNAAMTATTSVTIPSTEEKKP